MKIGDFELSQLVVALPVFHVACAALYLFWYSAGFGADLYTFMSPIDLFRVSIGRIVISYIVFLLLPAVNTLMAFRSDTAEDKVRSISDEVSRTAAWNTLLRVRRIMFAVGLAVIVLLILYELFHILSEGYILSWPIAFVVMIVALAFLYSIRDDFNLSRAAVETLAVVTVALIQVSSFAFSDGLSDRRANYADAVKVDPMCGRSAILKKISDLYLVARADGTKALADDHCEPRVVFPAWPVAAKPGNAPRPAPTSARPGVHGSPP